MVSPSIRTGSDPLGADPRFDPAREGPEDCRVSDSVSSVRLYARVTCAPRVLICTEASTLSWLAIARAPSAASPRLSTRLRWVVRPAPLKSLSTAMPSQSSRSRRSTSENPETDTSVQKPSWGSSPSDESAFVNALSTWLPFLDTNYSSLLARRTVLYGSAQSS